MENVNNRVSDDDVFVEGGTNVSQVADDPTSLIDLYHDPLTSHDTAPMKRKNVKATNIPKTPTASPLAKVYFSNVETPDEYLMNELRFKQRESELNDENMRLKNDLNDALKKIEELKMLDETKDSEYEEHCAIQKAYEQELIVKIQDQEQLNRALSRELDVQKKANQDENKEHQEFHVKIQDLEKQNRALSRELDVQKKANQDKNKEHQEFLLKIQDLEKQNRALSRELDVQKKANQDENKEHQEFLVKIQDLEKQNRASSRELDIQKKANEDENVQHQELLVKIQDLEKQNLALSRELDIQKKANEDENMQHQELLQMITKQSKTIENQKQLITALNDHYKDAEEEIEQLKKENNHLSKLADEKDSMMDCILSNSTIQVADEKVKSLTRNFSYEYPQCGYGAAKTSTPRVSQISSDWHATPFMKQPYDSAARGTTYLSNAPTHNPIRQLKCHLCDGSYKGEQGLGQHFLRTHPEIAKEKIYCNFCNKECIGMFGLGVHLRSCKKAKN